MHTPGSVQNTAQDNIKERKITEGENTAYPIPKK